MRAITVNLGRDLARKQPDWPNSMQVNATSGKLVVPSFCIFNPLSNMPVAASDYTKFSKWVGNAIAQHVPRPPKYSIRLAPRMQTQLMSTVTDAVPHSGTTQTVATAKKMKLQVMFVTRSRPSVPQYTPRQSLSVDTNQTAATFGYDAIKILPLTRSD